MKKLINIGVIGCGVVGIKRIFNLTKNFNLIACADPKINKIKKNKIFKNKKKIFFSKNWKDVLKLKNLDAVIISTVHNLHSKILENCIKNNIHVFVEKPAGVSDVVTKKILNKIKRKKNFLAVKVGFNHRYHPAFILAKKLVDKKKIGNLMYIRAVYGHGGRINYNKEWRFNQKVSGGGELIDKGSHLIDLSRLFLGNLEVFKGKIETNFWKTDLEDNCFLILTNKIKKVAFLHASCTEWKNKFLFEIFGKLGKLEINGLGKSYGKEKLIFYKMSKRMGPPKVKYFNFNSKIDISWQLELEDFYKNIIQKSQPIPGLLDAYENLKLIKKIYKSRYDNN